MIPVRARVDSPITTLGGVRPPMSPEHPLAGTPCPVCDGSLTDAPVTFVFVGVDPEQRDRRETWAAAAVVIVHAACAGVEPDKGIRRFLAKQGHDFEMLAAHEAETATYFNPAQGGGGTFTICTVCRPEHGHDDAYPCRFLIDLAAISEDAEGYNPDWDAS